MRELSLFTGAGGGLLGSLILGWEPVQFVEHDAYCQRVLAARFPDVPRHLDVRDFRPVPGSCDIVTGGFPCQPHSQAGNRLGGLDSRDLWPDTLRVLRESDAPLGFFENVPGLLTSRDAAGRSMFGGILGDLSEAGFDAEWCVLGADDVGAPHRRKRLWILAYRDGAGCEERRGAESVGAQLGPAECGGSPWWCDPADVCDPASRGQSVCRPQEQPRDERHAVRADGDGYEVDPWITLAPVGRVAAGIPARVDRLRGLGNAQCPHSMAAAFAYLAGEAGLLKYRRLRAARLG